MRNLTELGAERAIPGAPKSPAPRAVAQMLTSALGAGPNWPLLFGEDTPPLVPRTLRLTCTSVREDDAMAPSKTWQVFEARLNEKAPFQARYRSSSGRSAAQSLHKALAHFKALGEPIECVRADAARWARSSQLVSLCRDEGLGLDIVLSPRTRLVSPPA
jgi:hypothetical protein